MADRCTRDTIATPGGGVGDGRPTAPGAYLSALPVAVLALLLLVATWFDGAFAVRHWAPVAALGLVALAVAVLGGARVAGRRARAAVVALWAFAGWTVLSAVWAESPGRALEGGARTALYAVLFTAAVAVPIDGRAAARLGRAVVAGLAIVAVIALATLVGDGAAEFLAGRLDAPVGYRNATACLFAIAFWPLVATMARRTAASPARAAAFAAAVLVLGLAALTEARGALAGLLLGGVVALALGPDRLRRTWVALAAAGGLALVGDELLTPYRAFVDGEPERSADIAIAVDALVAVVGAAAAVGLIGALLDGGLRISQRTRASLRRVAATATAAVAIVATAGALAAVGDPVAFVGERLDEFESLETAAAGETRLAFGGGQRADIWRVALLELSERPLTGVGEGSYQYGYYEHRRTDRNLSAPHSLVFGVLAEKGLVGAALLMAFLGAVAAATASRWRNAASERRWVASGLLAAAAVGFGHAAVDWIWLVPGVMGLAFLLLGLGVASLAPDGAPSVAPRGARRMRVAIAAGLVAAAVGVALLYVSDLELRSARVAQASAGERGERARAAERLNPWSVDARYLQAGALEELGRRDAARRELHEALDLEPASFVTYALLGDLELRDGDGPSAARWYRRALALNPLDAGLRELARRA
ncbi:MAG: O-antigen ligase family protein, partial [Thermoleophilaceae bacterium]